MDVVSVDMHPFMDALVFPLRQSILWNTHFKCIYNKSNIIATSVISVGHFLLLDGIETCEAFFLLYDNDFSVCTYVCDRDLRFKLI